MADYPELETQYMKDSVQEKLRSMLCDDAQRDTTYLDCE